MANELVMSGNVLVIWNYKVKPGQILKPVRILAGPELEEKNVGVKEDRSRKSAE